MFDFKNDEIKSAPRSLLLNHTQKIMPSSDLILQELLKQYSSLGAKPSPYLKASCTLANAIVTHERIYFALTRTAMKVLAKNDINIQLEYRSSFGNTCWPKMLAMFYNDFKIVKLVYEGIGRNASTYEVIHPELLKYLEPKVNREKQLAETLAFCQKKVSK